MIYHKSSGGVLFSSDFKKVYLIRKNKRNELSLPKGHIEEGETPIDAAKREIVEETGFKNFIILGSTPCNTIKYQFEESGVKNEKVVYFFTAIVLDEKSIPTKEMQDEGLSGKWFNFEDAITASNLANIKETIIKAYELSKNLRN